MRTGPLGSAWTRHLRHFGATRALSLENWATWPGAAVDSIEDSPPWPGEIADSSEESPAWRGELGHSIEDWPAGGLPPEMKNFLPHSLIFAWKMLSKSPPVRQGGLSRPDGAKRRKERQTQKESKPRCSY